MTGKPFLDKILLAVNGVVALGAAGLVFYAHNMIKRVPTDQKAEEAALTTSAYQDTQIKPYSMKPIIVNLYAEGSRLRYLEVELGVLTFNEADKDVLKENEYIIKNALIQIAATMTPDELTSVTGKILLESRLKKAINEAFKNTIIKQIYFAKFIVQ